MTAEKESNKPVPNDVEEKGKENKEKKGKGKDAPKEEELVYNHMSLANLFYLSHLMMALNFCPV